MEVKIAWKSENMQKKAWRKSMLKFDAEKKADAHFEIAFWLDFWSGPGGKWGGWIQDKISERLQLWISHAMHPRRGAADENLCPNGPQKSSQNQHLGDQWSDFWVLGSVLRNVMSCVVVIADLILSCLVTPLPSLADNCPRVIVEEELPNSPLICQGRCQSL